MWPGRPLLMLTRGHLERSSRDIVNKLYLLLLLVLVVVLVHLLTCVIYHIEQILQLNTIHYKPMMMMMKSFFRHSTLLLWLLFAALQPLAIAAVRGKRHSLRRCLGGQIEPRKYTEWQNEVLTAFATTNFIATQALSDVKIEIPVFFWALNDGQNGIISQAVAEQNVQELNRFLEPANVHFTLKRFESVYDASFTIAVPNFDPNSADAWSRAQQRIDQVRRKYRIGGLNVLNIVTADLSAVNLLGIASFPQDAALKLSTDAVLMTWQSLAGLPSYTVGFDRYNLGR